MMNGAKRLRIDNPKPDNIHITSCISKTLSLQKRQKLKDFEESLQGAFRFKNCFISKLKLENSDMKTYLKEMEESIANQKLERETLIKSFKNKFAKRNEEDLANINSLQEKDINTHVKSEEMEVQIFIT